MVAFCSCRISALVLLITGAAHQVMRPVQIIQHLDFRELVETALERLVVQRNRIKSAVLARWRGGQAFNQVPVRVEREVVKIELGFSQIVIGLLGIQYIVYRIDRRYRRVQLRESRPCTAEASSFEVRILSRYWSRCWM